MKKWFLTQRQELVDLNSFHSIKVIENDSPLCKSNGNFLVVTEMLDILAEFDTVAEAVEYIKKIHLFLVAQ